MLNYFVCPCIFDVVFVSNPKEITQLIESGFLDVKNETIAHFTFVAKRILCFIMSVILDLIFLRPVVI